MGPEHCSHSWEWLRAEVTELPGVGGGGQLSVTTQVSPGSKILGIRRHTVSLRRRAAPSPGGVGRSAAGLLAGDTWAAQPGISLQTLTVSFLCCFLPVPTPHLCKSPGILLPPAAGRAKALGEEIDRAFPLHAALLGPSMTHCPWSPGPHPSQGEEAQGGAPVSKSGPGASDGCSPVCPELFTSQLWDSYSFGVGWS